MLILGAFTGVPLLFPWEAADLEAEEATDMVVMF
jgi:hypothetical protein